MDEIVDEEKKESLVSKYLVNLGEMNRIWRAAILCGKIFLWLFTVSVIGSLVVSLV